MGVSKYYANFRTIRLIEFFVAKPLQINGRSSETETIMVIQSAQIQYIIVLSVAAVVVTNFVTVAVLHNGLCPQVSCT